MKTRNPKIYCWSSIFITLLFGGLVQAQQIRQNRFLDTLRMGIRYQVQEFHSLNQKLADNCNCDEGERLKERALQGIALSVLEPLSPHWALGADFGASFGRVMDDARNYQRYSLVQLRTEVFYHVFKESSKLRPYVSGGVQLAANAHKAFFGFPLGAGLRYSLAKGGSLHLQTAYDGGMRKAMAKNMITQIGFHVPLYQRSKGLSPARAVQRYTQLSNAKPVQ